MIKLNLSYEPVLIKGYINIGMKPIKQLQEEYPNQNFDKDVIIKEWDIANLPLESESVDEIRAVKFFEYLTPQQEQIAFYEIARVLKHNAVFDISVPDFDQIMQFWLTFQDDEEDWLNLKEGIVKSEHWFGTYEFSYRHKWGYLLACIFGNHNKSKQYHKNCYTTNKLLKIFKTIGFDTAHQTFLSTPRSEYNKVIHMTTRKNNDQTI